MSGSKNEMEELLDECMKEDEDLPQTEDSPPPKKKSNLVLHETLACWYIGKIIKIFLVMFDTAKSS